jgi:hypothetical protein
MTLHRPHALDRAVDPTMTPLQRLTALGTRVWLDGLVPYDELQRLTHAAGVTGLTSNRTIFRAAVLGSGRYHERIAALGGRTAAEIYETIALDDVRAAADVLAPIYDRTDGADGFVSLEVAPALADDADATLAAARELWARIDRPNAMIKLPATAAGVEATRRAIADGVNVNVTLLFSTERYAAVIDAYLAGLEERLRRGQASSSRAWTAPSTRCWPRPAATTSSATPRSPTHGSRTRTYRVSSPGRASRRCAPPGRARSGRCGPRPAPRTPATATSSTSTSSPGPA